MEMVIDSLERRAREFFFKAHNDTNHTYGDKPYTFHLEHTADVARKFGYILETPERISKAIACAYGHDAVSDARVSRNDIYKNLGDIDVANICSDLVEDMHGYVRDDRNSDAYYARIKKTVIGVFVKLCDRIANLENGIWEGGTMSIKYKQEIFKFYENYIIHFLMICGNIYSH
ncbi:metal-dependent phosphohydrolase [Tenacibaculum phage PTm1]|uniref:Phosphohydrolase n=1 Tax=Tenacibaculum phage PTm1 TaxID=2547425 RepID=A0A5S9C152_9CAUD|nr:metal-dependent phosphohydrolase [Tenacibaculum phage PTm1]BBI90623.1 phosphohydrolase [Tenacibaculum phage PTm1]